jgi:hypothetical protein
LDVVNFYFVVIFIQKWLIAVGLFVVLKFLVYFDLRQVGLGFDYYPGAIIHFDFSFQCFCCFISVIAHLTHLIEI